MIKKIGLVALLGIILAFAPLNGFTATEYTGEYIQKVPVITKLDTSSLWKGRIYKFYLQTTQNSINQYWYVPVTVIRGSKSGKNLLIAAGLRGTERRDLEVTFAIRQALDPQKLSGTVTIVHNLNPSGLLHNHPGYKSGLTFDGNPLLLDHVFSLENESEHLLPSEIFARLVWNNLLQHNSEYAIHLYGCEIDYHCVYQVEVDSRDDDAFTMAKLLNAEVVHLADGEKGSIATTFINQGIPATTVRVGNRKHQTRELVARASEGILNYMRHLRMLEGEVQSHQPAFTNEQDNGHTVEGGYLITKVVPNDLVQDQQRLANQYNEFGHLVRWYFATANDRIVIKVRKFPTGESGTKYMVFGWYNPKHTTQTLSPTEIKNQPSTN